MNPVKLFFDKNIYKNIYEENNIYNKLKYIILASIILTSLYLYSPMKSLNNSTDIIFIEKILKSLPTAIAYDDELGFMFSDDKLIKTNLTYNLYLFGFIKTDFIKKNFDIKDFDNNTQIIISNKSIFYKDRNKINSFSIEEIGKNLKNFTLENNEESISILQGNKIIRTFSLADLSNILKRIFFMIKVFTYFSLLLIIILTFFSISFFLSLFYSFILKKRGKKLILHKLMFSFYPVLFINIIFTFFLSLINIKPFMNLIYKFLAISQFNLLIFFIYSLIITFNFLKEKQQQCIEKKD